MRMLYHLLLDQINPAVHEQLLMDCSITKLRVGTESKFRHGQQVPDIKINDRWLSEITRSQSDPITNANAVIVPNDWPGLAWLLLNIQN